MSYARFGSPLQEFATTDEYMAWRRGQQAAINALDDSAGWGDKVPDEYKGSDVYVYFDIGGYLCCCGCCLGKKWDFHSTDEMIAHLEEHRAAGHRVPQSCIDRLEDEREENDSKLAAATEKLSKGRAEG